MENKPSLIRRIINKVKHGKSLGHIPVGSVNWGSFKRTTPLSTSFGFDRGLPVDRYYIEKFLGENSADIKGVVLEIADNTYTRQFGKDKVLKSEALHITAGHPEATIIGDLSRANEIPIADNLFDCIILTQTLHLIYEYENAIRQCHRILKPGGILLLTSPGISQIDNGEWNDNWLWSFNRQSMHRIMQENFSPGTSHIAMYGNVFSATSFLWGVSTEEIPDKKMLDVYDPSYPVIVAVRAIKQY